MITTSHDRNSQSAIPPPQQRVPPHFCFQRQIASPTKISHNSQIHHPASRQEPSPNTLQTQTATEPQPITDNLTKACQQPGPVYQPQSGYPEIDQSPAHHDADSEQQDSADHEEGLLDHSEVLQPQSMSPHSAPAEGKSHLAEAASHLPASHSSRSDSQTSGDHIALDSSEADANQQAPEAAPVQILQLRRPQCSRITAQLLPERLAVSPSNHGGSCQHSDETAKADKIYVDAMLGSDPVHGPHKSTGTVRSVGPGRMS